MIKLAALLCKSHKREKKVYKREKKGKHFYDDHFEFVYIYCDLHFKIR